MGRSMSQLIIGKDHPGFSDEDYVRRRNAIALIAENYRVGDLIPEVPYVSEEHNVWRDVYRKLELLYPQFAIAEYNECFKKIELWDSVIPQFSTLNRKLFDYCFEVSPVPGLVSAREFLSELANSRMSCTQYIRHHSVPEYTPEPDIIHEVFGHAVFFLNEDMRELNRLFGKAALSASDEEVGRLIRLYWHTIEFGVCVEEGSIKAYGAGLLSSAKELSGIQKIPLRKFDIEEMTKTTYDTMNPQGRLFCAESFEYMVKKLKKYFEHSR